VHWNKESIINKPEVEFNIGGLLVNREQGMERIKPASDIVLVAPTTRAERRNPHKYVETGAHGAISVDRAGVPFWYASQYPVELENPKLATRKRVRESSREKWKTPRL
jgi:hypothetical protein